MAMMLTDHRNTNTLTRAGLSLCMAQAAKPSSVSHYPLLLLPHNSHPQQITAGRKQTLWKLPLPDPPTGRRWLKVSSVLCSNSTAVAERRKSFLWLVFRNLWSNFQPSLLRSYVPLLGKAPAIQGKEKLIKRGMNIQKDEFWQVMFPSGGKGALSRAAALHVVGEHGLPLFCPVSPSSFPFLTPPILPPPLDYLHFTFKFLPLFSCSFLCSQRARAQRFFI